MSLTDTAIRKTKPTATVQKLRDGGGLYLLLRPDGAKWWRWDYRSTPSLIRALSYVSQSQWTVSGVNV